MVKPVLLPPLEVLLDKFTYCPISGTLSHNKGYSNFIKAGDYAGSYRKDGYLQVKVSSKAYLVHHICYYMHTGEMPEYIDHLNKIRSDNRFINLRSCTHAENMKNKSDYSNNITGERNISYHSRDCVYEVKFKVDGKQHYVGRSKTLEGAIAIRDSWHDTH